MYTFFITIHLITAILFIGTVYFRTFVMLPLCKDGKMREAHILSGQRGRAIMLINVMFLITSGAGLAWHYFQTNDFPSLLIVKIGIATLALFLFFIAQIFLQKFGKIKGMEAGLHYALFGIMMLIVILAKSF